MHFAKADAAVGHTHAVVGGPSQRKQCPIVDLEHLIKESRLKADLLVTPGDMTLKSCRVGLEAAWARIEKFSKLLDAGNFAAATGNHDIMSRSGADEPEIWETLKRLNPQYPCPTLDEVERLRYWADHFSVIDEESYRVVLFNSCNCHARGSNEFERGRITDYTLTKITERISAAKGSKLNILLCHHHPSKLPDVSARFPDYSEMIHGDALLRAIEETEQSWIVIHGHKHLPNLSYAKGGAASSVIFSCGSFSAALPPEFLPGTANQFYILDFDLDSAAMGAVRGTVESWDWCLGAGWSKASFDDQRRNRIVREGLNKSRNFWLDTGVAARLFQHGPDEFR
ncbi:hypothetical protein C7S18_10125 [Ahniella affigens]|uniref:Calcineurin-like phosphoesterase domain-containing protein n=2 Tax=Ahniella affigens TaxID=2021234 RepID=A0A2P1PRR3_9GAMM|nr:hypothetical protein C7S18_10125 [Ahniella affigens]